MSDIVFNDTSLFYTSLTTAEEAQKAFEYFIEELAAAIDERIVESVIRSQGSLLDAEITLSNGDKWSVYDWFDGPLIDQDARRLILTLDNKVPTEINYQLSEAEEVALMENEYFARDISGPPCFAFGFALHTGNIVASVPTHKIWEESSLSGVVVFNGQALRRGVVHHFSKFDHTSEIKKSLGQTLFDSISGRADFVAQKNVLFPNLKFSPDFDAQAEELTSRQILTLLEKLQKMEKTAEKWKLENSALPEYQFSWRRESASTMGKKSLRKAREFRLPDGEIAIFENHLDFSSSHRIHFIEDADNKTFIVGYAGGHLPTVLYPH